LDIFKIHNSLKKGIEAHRLIKNAPMKEYTSFKVGGEVKLLVLPGSMKEVSYAISVCKAYDVQYYIMGKGSNLIVKEKGYDGIIIKLSDGFNEISVQDDLIIAQSGALMSALASKASQYSLSGLEFASGIPGTVGGAVVMNAGAYGGEMSHITYKVKALDPSGVEKVFSNSELNFGYRDSIFHYEPYVVLEVHLKLIKGQQETIKNRMKELADRRNSKQPMNYPSAGSIFKRPQGHYASKLIEDAGLKGLSIGGARVSPLHAGFIINEGTATSQDILDLIAIIQSTVQDKFDITLEPEVKIIGSD